MDQINNITSEEGDLTSSNFWAQRYEGLTDSPTWITWLRSKAHWQFDRMLVHLLDSASKKEMSVLEIGCAPGNILGHIHRLRPQHRLYGIDFVLMGVEITRQKLSAAGIPAVIEHGDVRDFYPAEKFDLVISAGFIEHFTDPIEMLAQHVRLAKQGGHVAVTIPNYAHPLVRSLIHRFDAHTLESHNLSIMSKAALREAMQKVDLSHVRVGGACGPRFRPGVAQRSHFSSLYQRTARLWNTSIAQIPIGRATWQAEFWAIGRVDQSVNQP